MNQTIIIRLLVSLKKFKILELKRYFVIKKKV